MKKDVHKQRQMIRVTLQDDIDIDYSSLDQAIDKLNRLKEEYKDFQNLELVYETPAYSETRYLALRGSRLETESELQIRLHQIEVEAKRKEERDKLEYERLRKIYENNSK